MDTFDAVTIRELEKQLDELTAENKRLKAENEQLFRTIQNNSIIYAKRNPDEQYSE